MSDYPDEIWLPVRGYEGLYEVSNLGRVRRTNPSFFTGRYRYMKQWLTPYGYF
jgi:hypothetical protein